MPTSFTTVSAGQTILAAHINQFASPINALENATRKALVAILSGQTLAAGYNKLLFASPTRNDGLLTAASSTYTATKDSSLHIALALFSSNAAQVNLLAKINSSYYWQAPPTPINNGCYANFLIPIATGEALELWAYSSAGSVVLDVSIPELRKLVIVEA